MCEFSCRHSAAWALRSVAVRTANVSRLLSLFVLTLFCGGLVPRLAAQAPTPVTVPTWRYDNTHAGANTNETALTPANVNQSAFGKLFSVTVDGSVYAQPLYVPGLTMSDGLVHNVFFVATEHDSIYAFDADSNSGANAHALWHITLLDAAHGAPSGATTVPGADPGGQGDIGPEIGITGTPVIDPSTNTLYVVGKTKESGAYFNRLHAISILTGAEQAHSPVLINATVAGTGNGSSGGKLTFSQLWENQRPALGLFNGHVYIGFGAHGDYGPWHGWVFSYDAATLTQTAVLCLSPNGIGDSVWQAGAGMPIDTSVPGGRMFFATGNGTYATYPPFNASSEFGDSIVEIDLSNGGLKPVDAFTPFNQAKLSSADLDQGSGGILMLPDQQGAKPHILVQVGKEGRILVLNRDQLGGYATGVTSNTNALQDIPNQVKGMWSTPAYWNGNVYIWGSGDYGSYDTAKLFKINSGILDTTPSSVSNFTSGHPGVTFSVSSNGSNDGIAWAVRVDAFTTHGNAILYAFDANDLTNVLWESDTNSTRDAVGWANKFAVPVVTNGKVYVSAVKIVDVYGLFNNTSVAATPVISPNGGTFAGSQNVTLSSATSSASIYYTLDGSAPTPASTLYTDPIAISTSTTIRAIATASGFVQSAVSSASFTLSNQTPAATFQPGAGTYSATQMVTLSDTDTAATLYYTTDGSTPTASSKQYTGPISVAASMTIKAIAIDPSLQNSSVATAAYTIQAGGSPTINFGNGFASVAGLKLNGTAISTNNLLQLTSTIGTYQTGTVFWNQPVGIQTFSTDFLLQQSSAQGDGFTFTIQNVGATALGASGSGLGYQNIGKSVAIKFDLYSNSGEGTDSTGVYTNGAVPTVPAVDMTASGVVLKSGDSMLAHVTYDGTTLSMTLTDQVTHKVFSLSKAINIPQVVGANTAFVGFTGSTGGLSAIQKILTWTYSTQASSPVTSAPVFSPSAGSYTTAQNVTITDSTSGAVIYYTTNGTTPTTSSSVYSGAIAVGTGTTTIEAMAVASGSSQSAVITATYVVSAAVTASPTFSPGGGNYSTAQNITITDSTPGAVIYYTTNGTTPTTASSVYSGQIAVGTGTTTIEAMAVASGSSPSAVVTATYIVSTGVTAPPTFSPAAGTYSTPQSVTLTDSTAGAVIYYTTNGTTPSTSSTVYSSPISVAVSETIKAIATAPNMQLSSTATAVYTIQSGTPTINFLNGFSSTAGLSLHGSTTVTKNLLQLTLATAAASSGSVWFATPVNINAFTTDFNFQLLSAKADGFTFVMQNAGVTALGPGGSGLGYGATHPGGTGGLGRSVAVKFDLYSNNGEGADSTGFYTNGASPTVPATDMTASGVKLNSGHAMHAHITYDGTNLTLVLTDTVTSQSFTQTSAINIPSIVGSGTAYVGFTAATGGLTMTTDILNWTMTAGGTMTAAIKPLIGRPSPSGGSVPKERFVYTPAGATAGAAEVSKADIAPLGMPGLSKPDGAPTSEPTSSLEVATKGQPAVVEVHTAGVAGEPRFSPEPGVFGGDTEVTLRCDTPGATIHYTFDGSQPGANSPVYSAPISVKGTALTIKAFASVPGQRDSAVVMGMYRIRE
jgi:hypothetical protein